ncbi:nuclear transport factor 2 family protein [Chryseobacterium sp. C-71]|uniref:YybH family protein n=1 Tax=Chryseobacterium sp. C-71 TaxID=2893882 RepID=UPI001E5B05B1|nr:nuclear transport factor 2 family protein [Chryseobacterium sp. C-71]UFH33066.1 nuclear transport factor 2 family protein [Chryseobacterium sp. C-71]
MNHNKNKVKEKILNFESALNLGNIEDVLSFYSDEAIFMPDGNKTLKKSQIGKSGAEFLIESNFKIQFENVKIAIDENYAFVDAIAQTSQNDKEISSKLERTSRDFFVLRKEEGDWKIFRYIFNNNVITSKL